MKTSINGQLPASASDLNFQDPIGVSQLGNPIFDDITFPAGSYLTLEGVSVDYQELKLQSVRFTVQMAKNIVRTAISGRPGTVKEFNNDGDYIIQGQASLSENDPIFPRDQMIQFVGISRVPQQIPVISKILNTFFDIDNVILSQFRVDPGHGAGNVLIGFTLESDSEFDLSQFIIS